MRDPLAAIREALETGYPGSDTVKIGVIDGPPDLSHPVFRRSNIDVLKSMLPENRAVPDRHGTSVCSLIFGSDNAAPGLAPGCPGLVLPIFSGRRPQEGVRPASQLDLARAVAFAVERGASIINISAGQKTSTAEAEAHLTQSLERCVEEGILVVAAAGNDGCPCIHLPAVIQSVLAVGALGVNGQPLDASNWGEPYRQNGLLAPGENLLVAVPGGETAMVTGTSFATAVVSGVAALLLSIAHREGYRIRAGDVRQILIESAAPCLLQGEGACDRYLAGVLDTSEALARLHRSGTRSISPAGVVRNISRDIAVKPSMSETITGDVVMSNSNPEPSVAAAVEAQGVLPSACNCETKPDEQPKVDVRPQALASSPTIAPVMTPVQQSAQQIGLNQLACSCGGGQPPQIVFALGALWFDFGTEARYDAIVQQLGDPVRANTPSQLFAFLRENPHFVSGITFILMQDQIPLYAVQPAGPFAPQTYSAIFDALESSLDEKHSKEQRVSIPGLISGSTRLLNGMTVPVIYPDLRGMYKWQSHELIAAAKAAVGKDVASEDEILNFLNRVYYELRNLGVAPQERAINFAATNAYQTQVAFAESAGRNLALDSIQVVKSPICRPDSDCWDVQLQMFDPENERRASRVYRYTVDVSEMLPVTVGSVRSWVVRTGTL
jgi:cyanobactin maturation PatA/PatG family protease